MYITYTRIRVLQFVFPYFFFLSCFIFSEGSFLLVVWVFIFLLCNFIFNPSFTILFTAALTYLPTLSSPLTPLNL